MFYYKLNEEGYVELYTDNVKVAKRHNLTLTSEIEPVLQGDGSGYVFPNDYIAPEIIEEPTLEERITAIEETMLEIMFPAE